MGETSIEWADRTVNPIRARHRVTGKRGHWCVKVSAGCKHCYSSAWQKFRGTGLEFLAGHEDDVEVYFEPKAAEEVLRRRKPTRFFWCDMTDMFGEWVPDEWIDRIFAVMAVTPQHTHLVLTKRAEPMTRHFSDPAFRGRVTREASRLWDATPRIRPYGLPSYLPRPWPLPNCWLGVSVEDQPATARIVDLLAPPAAVRFLSVEPLLGAVDLARYLRPKWTPTGEQVFDDDPESEWLETRRVDWIIVGCESGPRRRNQDEYATHARAVIEQCRAAGVPVFHKQMPINGRVSHDPAEWPADLRIRYFPDRKETR